MAETKPNPKMAYWTSVVPNKILVFIGLVGSESDKLRIRDQAF